MVYQSKFFAILGLSAIFMTHASYGMTQEGNPQSENAPHPSAVTDEETASIFGIETEIVADVQFEPRKTRVLPEANREEGKARISQTYWSVVFLSGENRYLLRGVFFLGQDEIPEVIELNGVPITPGARVKVQGQVFTSNPGFHVLLDVDQITIL